MGLVWGGQSWAEGRGYPLLLHLLKQKEASGRVLLEQVSELLGEGAVRKRGEGNTDSLDGGS